MYIRLRVNYLVIDWAQRSGLGGAKCLETNCIQRSGHCESEAVRSAAKVRSYLGQVLSSGSLFADLLDQAHSHRKSFKPAIGRTGTLSGHFRGELFLSPRFSCLLVLGAVAEHTFFSSASRCATWQGKARRTSRAKFVAREQNPTKFLCRTWLGGAL